MPFLPSVPAAHIPSVSEQITVMTPHLASSVPSHSPIFHAFEEDTFIAILQGQTSSPHMALKSPFTAILLPFAPGCSLQNAAPALPHDLQPSWLAGHGFRPALTRHSWCFSFSWLASPRSLLLSLGTWCLCWCLRSRYGISARACQWRLTSGGGPAGPTLQ